MDRQIPITEAAEDISDSVRYTLVYDLDDYTHSCQQALRILRSNGNNARVKNFWARHDNPYQGINIALISPEGNRLELQFHTVKSLEIKEVCGLHDLYEKQRILSEDDPEYLRLKEAMFEITSVIEVPDGIEEIE